MTRDQALNDYAEAYWALYGREPNLADTYYWTVQDFQDELLLLDLAEAEQNMGSF